MKHIRLFEDYSDSTESDLLSDLGDLGFNNKLWRLLFNGVIPNGDDFAGNWSIVTREIQTEGYSLERALQKLKNGEFRVILEKSEDEEYLGGSLERSKIMEIAKSSSDLEEIWEEINQRLYDAGEKAYIDKWADEDDEYGDEYGDKDDIEYPHGERVNLEAFSEVWNTQNPEPKIIVKDI